MSSMWSLLLYISIPCALLLLAVILFCHGVFQRLNDMAMLLVGRFIFGRFNVLPFPLIQMLLVLHALSALWMGINVYYWHSNHPAPSHTAHHTISLEYNAKAWRKQRNLYLLCLSLVLWWMLYSVYQLKMQLDRAHKALVDAKSKAVKAQ